MCRKIEAIIAREEAFLPKFAPGTSQHSLLANRISALRTVFVESLTVHPHTIQQKTITSECCIYQQMLDIATF